MPLKSRNPIPYFQAIAQPFPNRTKKAAHKHRKRPDFETNLYSSVNNKSTIGNSLFTHRRNLSHQNYLSSSPPLEEAMTTKRVLNALVLAGRAVRQGSAVKFVLVSVLSWPRQRLTFEISGLLSSNLCPLRSSPV